VTRQGVLRWCWHHGPMTVLAAVLLALSCGWLASLGSHPASAASPPASAENHVTAEGIHDDLAAVLADQRQADRDHREAWIADGYSSDLATLVNDTDQAGSNPGQLDADARAFSDDGWAYLDATGLTAVSPPPGWQPEYAQLRSDLNALAADAGLAPVPAPRGAISAAPGRANVPVPVNVPDPNACTSATTTTNSSSDTGASSHSVAVKNTCGTTTTTNTNKTAVSAKGKVTHTTTNSTKTAPPGSTDSSGSSGP
jgi:hypothetical protein